MKKKYFSIVRYPIIDPKYIRGSKQRKIFSRYLYICTAKAPFKVLAAGFSYSHKNTKSNRSRDLVFFRLKTK